MIEFEYDDGGREASGRQGEARDCMVRALSIYFPHLGYDNLYAMVADANAKAGRPRSARNGVATKEVRDKLMADMGFLKAIQRGPKMTFSQAWERYGNCIVTTTRHIACLRDGALRDTFDCRVYEWEGEARERLAQSIFYMEA